LSGFTREAARELSPFGIHVHGVQSDREQIVKRVFALLSKEDQ
jgi:NAD(P)-dependent dehydrogenase (short-subunit alcohol dehydrogenase family)